MTAVPAQATSGGGTAGDTGAQQRALVPASGTEQESYKLLMIFVLAGQEYGLLASSVREIIRNRVATRVPNSPPCILGVINLRGRIIPVFDLHRRLNLPELSGGTREAQAVMVVEQDDEDAGLLVDRVTDVVKITESDIDRTTQLIEANLDKQFTEGVVTLDKRLVTLLKLEALLEA